MITNAFLKNLETYFPKQSITEMSEQELIKNICEKTISHDEVKNALKGVNDEMLEKVTDAVRLLGLIQAGKVTFVEVARVMMFMDETRAVDAIADQVLKNLYGC
jgi:hypothetical protein